MPPTPDDPPLATILRRVVHDLPAGTITDLATGHALLQAMLARLPSLPPAAEPATTFRPDTSL
jgi:hypothetical protein